MERKIIDTLILTLFFISVFYFVKNIYISKHNLRAIKVYKTNIKTLKNLLSVEKNRRNILKKEYVLIQKLKKQKMQAYIRDYLFMVNSYEQIYLKKE